MGKLGEGPEEYVIVPFGYMGSGGHSIIAVGETIVNYLIHSITGIELSL